MIMLKVRIEGLLKTLTTIEDITIIKEIEIVGTSMKGGINIQAEDNTVTETETSNLKRK